MTDTVTPVPGREEPVLALMTSLGSWITARELDGQWEQVRRGNVEDRVRIGVASLPSGVESWEIDTYGTDGVVVRGFRTRLGVPQFAQVGVPSPEMDHHTHDWKRWPGDDGDSPA